MLQLMLKLGEHMSPNQPGFHPERWLDERGHLIEQPPSFMPFGGGPRLCLGWMLAKVEIKVGLSIAETGPFCSMFGPLMTFTRIPFLILTVMRVCLGWMPAKVEIKVGLSISWMRLPPGSSNLFNQHACRRLSWMP